MNHFYWDDSHAIKIKKGTTITTFPAIRKKHITISNQKHILRKFASEMKYVAKVSMQRQTHKKQ